MGTLGRGRFEVRGSLGAGSFGSVLAAFDHERRGLVAIKRPHQPSAEALVRFKREFRALADVSHANLVTLYELFEEHGAWYFTMELVDGAPLTIALRGAPASREEDAPTSAGLDPLAQTFAAGATTGAGAAVPGTGEVDGGERVAAAPVDLERLRACFAQLCAAIGAIHAAGLLHRDLKPSNVLVDRDGRVVVLDFGLAASHDGGAAERSFAGTPAYMAPEQWLSDPVGEDSDWYSVGVMLYECLTGARPFAGELFEMMQAKAAGQFVPPRARWPAVPPELEAACCALLDPRPERRREGVRALRGAVAGSGGPVAEVPARTGRVFVGRERELATLDEALQACARGAAGVVHVVAESGFGKTSLCEEFVARARGSATVLRGRCHEQESVPYKALDAAVDELSQELRRREGAGVRLRPADAAALVRTFPVLEMCFGTGEFAGGRSGPSPVVVRQRAVQALGEVLRRLSQERPLVVWLDDVQWGDADSAAVLGGLLRPPDPPRLLVLLTYRGDEAGGSAFLRELEGPTARRIELDRLSEGACREMVAALTSEAPPRLHVEKILREAGGIPLFVDQLARFTRDATGSESLDSSVSGDARGELLARVVQRHLAALPPGGRTIAELAAVAGAQLEIGVLRVAAGQPALDRATLQPLRQRHLIRLRSVDGRELLSIQHAKIAAIVAGGLPPADRQARHAALAEALAAAGAEPRLIAGHYHAAGDLWRAGAFARVAAERAAGALAFEEAAACWGLAVAWDPGDAAEQRALRRRRADALVHAGRLRDAAPEYLSLVDGAGPEEQLELRRLAAEQMLSHGAVEEGSALFREVAEAHGLGTAESSTRALLGVAYGIVRLKLRGTAFVPRPTSAIERATLAKIEAAYAGARSFATVSPRHALHFSVQALRLALDAGDLPRLPEGLAAVGAALALSGDEFGRALLGQAVEISEQLGAPQIRGPVAAWRAIVEHTDLRWEGALRLWDEAAGLLGECPGLVAELLRVRGLSLMALQHLGRHAELEARCAEILAAARETGNVYCEVTGLTYSAPALLARGEVAEARRRIAEAGDRTPSGVFTSLSRLKMLAHCELYEGAAGAALAWIEAGEPEIEALRMRTIRHFKITVGSFHAGCALQAMAEGTRDRRAMLKVARRELGRFTELRVPFARAAAAAVRAGLALAEGDRAAATGELRAALALFTEGEFPLERAACERRLGRLVGGSAGAALVAGADASLRALGIAEPARWVTAFYPGLPP